MALNNISELSTTAASNTDFAGTSILGTGLVSTADDSFRNLGSFLAKQWSDLGAVNTVGGTANAITITTPTVYTALKTGMFFYFTAALFNTSAVTLNLDSIGAKAVRVASDGTDIALIPGDIRAKGRYLVIYDSTANSAAGAWILFNAESNARYAPGTLYGLTLSNNSGTPAKFLDFAAGACRDSADSCNMDFAAAITAKDLETAWSVGSSGGLLATGSAVANGTYHIFAIKRPDTGVCDYAADTSVTGANIATNTNAAYTKLRRIGSIVRSGGSILAFKQVGDLFRWDVAVGDVVATNPGTSAVSRTLTLPTGIAVEALVYAQVFDDSQSTVTVMALTPLSITDTGPSQAGTASITIFGDSVGGNVLGSGQFRVMTNTSAQIRSRLSFSDADVTLTLDTIGWVDLRGRI